MRSTGARWVLSSWRLLPCLALAGSLGLPLQAHAQRASTLFSPTVLFAQGQDTPDMQAGADDADAGPVRLARFANVTGDVTWRDSTEGSWSAASRNMPLRQGAQIWVSDGGRAEVQFDDGSRVRLDSNTLITLQTLYSDADGEFTEITLNDGRAYLRLTNKYSVYQVNTPQASLKAAGPAQIGVGGGKDAEFGVRSGAAAVEGKLGRADLQAGDFLYVTDANTTYNVKELPSPNSWEAWNLRQDEMLDNTGRRTSHLPSNIALVADDLDSYGSWHDDPQYGWVWAPRVVEADWRPYRAGHWTWVEPFGWTWVSNENWGWAPYHYGSWVHQPYGWVWCPGPSVQYWSPGVVSFTENAGVMAWCPLAPGEVRYPSRLALGFRNGNWSAFFSIGGAAVYYPTSTRYCEPRPFRNVYVNRVTYVNHVTNVTNVYNVTNITVNHNTYLTNARFVPSNARWQGGTQVAVSSFGGRGLYQPAPGGAQSIFARGQVISAPVSGHPVAGPQSVRVTATSLTPTRVYRAPASLPQQVVNRTVYRGSLPTNVPRAAAQPQNGQRFTNRLNGSNPDVTHRNGGQPTLPGRPTNEKATFNSRNNAGRPDNGNVSHPPANGNPGTNTGRSSGLDAYLKDRENRKSSGNVTGRDGTNTGKPVISGGKDNTNPRRFGDGSNPTRTDSGTGRRNGDTTTGSNNSNPRRFGDSGNGNGSNGTGNGTPRRFGDSSAGADHTRRNGDTPTGTDRNRRFGDSSGGSKTDTTHRSGDNSNGSRTGNPRRSSDGTGGSHSGGDGSHSSHSGGTGGGSGSGSSRSNNNSGKGDSGKSGSSKTDTKSTDDKKDKKNP